MTTSRSEWESKDVPNVDAPLLTPDHVRRELELIHQKRKHRSRRTALFARLADAAEEGATVEVVANGEPVRFRLVSASGELDLRRKLAHEEDERTVYLVPFTRHLPRDIEASLATGRLRWPQIESLLPRRFGAKSCTARMRGSKLRSVSQRDGTRTYAKGEAPSIDLDDAWLVFLRNRLEWETITTEAQLFAAVLLDRERRGASLAAVLRDVPGARDELYEVLDRRLGASARWVVGAWFDEMALEVAAMAVVGEAARATLNQPGSAGFVVLMAAIEPRLRLVAKHPLAALRGGELAKMLVELGYLVPMFWPRLKDAKNQDALRRAILEQAEDVFAGDHVRPLARGSNRLPFVLEQRCQALLEAIDEVVETRQWERLEAVDRAVLEVLAHEGTRSEPHLREQVEMAARLAAFLVDPATKETMQSAAGAAAEVVRLATFHAHCGGWVDYARQIVRIDESGPLRKGLANLTAAVDRVRDDFDRRFATAYAQAIGAKGDRGLLRGAVRIAGRTQQVVLIEDVLSRMGLDVVARADDLKLLVLCMDGMSWANLAELWTSIRKTSFVPVSQGERAPVLAHVPTITRLSRSALFAGRAMTSTDKLDTGRDGERIEQHEGVRALHETPVMLLRGDVLGEGGALSSHARKQVLDGPRIVAVVVNAIDDQLKGSAQLRVTLSAETIRPLQALLEAAEDTGRLVLLTSDHGNVTSYRFMGAAARTGKDPEGMERGARHRFLRTGESPLADEMALPVGALERAKGFDRVAVAVHESLRYTTLLHAGEHGGASLAEAIAPAVLLSPRGLLPALEPLGVVPCPVEPPRFWELGGPRPEIDAPKIDIPPAAPPKRTGQASLAFEPPPREPAPALFEALLASKFFQAQLKSVSDQDRAQCLQAIELLIRRGGRMAQDPFGTELGIVMASARVAGLVSKLERVLNVDAEPVVEHDGKSRLVTLDLQLLRAVFIEEGHD